MAHAGLKILSANVRGFRTNVGELTHTVLRNKADVVVAVETFLTDECVTSWDRIPGYYKSAVLLCALYRPQWHGAAPFTFLTDQLDTIMATRDCQNSVIVGDLNQHLVKRAFTELTVVHGLTNHVTFPTHVRDSVQCSQLNRVGSSDHNAVLSHIGLDPASEETCQRVIWLWDRADWLAIKRVLSDTDWAAALCGAVDHNVATFTAILLAARAQQVPHRVHEAEPRDQPWFGFRCRLAAEDKYKAWGSVLGPILWNIYFNDLLQSLPVASAYADDCTVSHSYTSEETANVIDAANRQLGDITAWGRRWQVQFAAEKTQAMVTSRSREDSRLLEGKLKFGDDTLAIKDSINILGVEVDSRLSFDRHLETVARRASLRVTLLRRVRHLLDADGLMRLYKAQLDSLGHRRRVGALTVLHRAQVQHSSHLARLRVPWRRSVRVTRTVVSGDLLLEAPRTHTVMSQRAFTWATATLWNAFTVEVDVVAMNTQQVHDDFYKGACRWLIGYPECEITRARLPSKGQVLRKFYFHHGIEKKTKPVAAKEVIETVLLI
ncbi:Retrovirus-related Pol polyprotein from type-1 retrotransposable element R1 2 [Chionoecetes opilio]|uniref:Retrovirus-related Pol polyprotein from type-1 retrotransposable element R1 2 n=1 Tax=Chionoecetes opilio TaxID=41210 RepID=A0A8J5D0M6_CHIOP|nr:Retrovirus-related Pol polyprotein from type-1 retrotransposable element R1 2 [Chionoecetes opilio]